METPLSIDITCIYISGCLFCLILFRVFFNAFWKHSIMLFVRSIELICLDSDNSVLSSVFPSCPVFSRVPLPGGELSESYHHRPTMSIGFRSCCLSRFPAAVLCRISSGFTRLPFKSLLHGPDILRQQAVIVPAPCFELILQDNPSAVSGAPKNLRTLHEPPVSFAQRGP